MTIGEEHCHESLGYAVYHGILTSIIVATNRQTDRELELIKREVIRDVREYEVAGLCSQGTLPGRTIVRCLRESCSRY